MMPREYDQQSNSARRRREKNPEDINNDAIPATRTEVRLPNEEMLRVTPFLPADCTQLQDVGCHH